MSNLVIHKIPGWRYWAWGNEDGWTQ